MSKMFSCHFDLGNSTDGPIGFCARVTAKNEKEALGLLRERLPDSIYVHEDGWEYIEIYLSPHNISVDDISEWEEVDDERGCPGCLSNLISGIILRWLRRLCLRL